ncbi:zinc finger CCCH domain-containing protein 67-like isoform X2 [Diospyros lotus]|uniref:zinc finger CCCH domain-containing protein 67-like isoform X2 n=1 Tax=Diospyros lotus TaxID=55363 RepID=UPI0022557C24|nr:zinc finger CCCH domain-containing protein 67-like isoform X2 [Diospyros lotus]
MEGFEGNSAPKPYTDEPQHHQSHERPELGLGFQSPTPVHPDLNPCPLPPPGDLDPQFANEEHRNQKVGDQEIRNRQAVEETLQNHQQPLGEEPQNQQSVGEELQNQEEIEEGFHTPQSDGEEVLNEQTVNEELQNLVLEEREKVSEDGGDSEGDVGGAKSEGDEKGTLSGVDVEGGDGKETDDGKGSGGADKGNEDNNGSENEKNDDDDNNENVGEEIRVVGGLKEGRFRRPHYPLRPDADDCSYYMRHGTCKFGSNCKFNHPDRRRNQVREKDENSEKPEQSQQTECKVGDLQMQQYYLSTGGCKFGDACRFNHSGGKTPIPPPAAELNFVGLPIRPGKKECPFYMRNGSCKYGSNCRFNHPDPTTVGGDAHSGYGNGGSVSLQGASQSTLSWPSPRALNETGPFVPVMFSPTKNLPSPTPDWNYQAPLYAPPERSLPTPPAFALSSPAETNSFMHHKKHIPVDEFPERPGQPECSYFLKTGDCKYRSGCKFHHPKNRIPKMATCALSDKGLPLRPDQNICSHYSRYGICKFGPACKFDHPINYGHSASSAVSGPDVPSPFRKSRTTDGARAGAGENGNDTRIQQPVYE